MIKKTYMFKIKDNVDLWDLVGFGYERIDLLGDAHPSFYKKRIKNITVAIDVIFRRIKIYDIRKFNKNLSHKKKYIKDLIQAGLVEKVEK